MTTGHDKQRRRRHLEGEARRSKAMVRVEVFHHPTISRVPRAFVRHLLAKGQPASVDELDSADLPVNRHCTGPAVLGLRDLGLVRHVGWLRSTRASRNRGTQGVWELVDPDEAVAWLESDPEPPEETPAGPQSDDLPLDGPEPRRAERKPAEGPPEAFRETLFDEPTTGGAA